METPKTNNRFRIVTEELQDTAMALIERKFEELDQCVSEFSEGAKMLIDTKKKTYYFLDDECLSDAVIIIRDKYNESIEPVSIEEIQNWN